MSDSTEQQQSTGAARRSAKLRNAGFAVGIGSAAIIAALLYASKVKKPPRNGA